MTSVVQIKIYAKKILIICFHNIFSYFLISKSLEVLIIKIVKMQQIKIPCNK